MTHLRLGDATRLLSSLPEAAVHAIVTDPPYGLSFMGVRWDTYTSEEQRPDRQPHLGNRPDKLGSVAHPHHAPEQARLRQRETQALHQFYNEWLPLVLRALTPGGSLKAFGATRTHHRLALAMEQTGFTHVHTEAWTYATGFPKSLDVASAIDNAARGHPQGSRDPLKRGGSNRPERNALNRGGGNGGAPTGLMEDYNPTRILHHQDALRWNGHGTALKPAWEPILVGYKPT